MWGVINIKMRWGNFYLKQELCSCDRNFFPLAEISICDRKFLLLAWDFLHKIGTSVQLSSRLPFRRSTGREKSVHYFHHHFLFLPHSAPSWILSLSENFASSILQDGATEWHYSYHILATHPPYQQLMFEIWCGVPTLVRTCDQIFMCGVPPLLYPCF